MYTKGAVRQIYKDILKASLSVYDSVIAWCADNESINFLSFTLTASNLDIAMKQAAAWQNKFSEVPKDTDVLDLEKQCVEKSKLADNLLGKIGDQRNYTIHKNKDNEDVQELIKKALLELDSQLRSFGKA